MCGINARKQSKYLVQDSCDIDKTEQVSLPLCNESLLYKCIYLYRYRVIVDG